MSTSIVQLLVSANADHKKTYSCSISSDFFPWILSSEVVVFGLVDIFSIWPRLYDEEPEMLAAGGPLTNGLTGLVIECNKWWSDRRTSSTRYYVVVAERKNGNGCSSKLISIVFTLGGFKQQNVLPQNISTMGMREKFGVRPGRRSEHEEVAPDSIRRRP